MRDPDRFKPRPRGSIDFWAPRVVKHAGFCAGENVSEAVGALLAEYYTPPDLIFRRGVTIDDNHLVVWDSVPNVRLHDLDALAETDVLAPQLIYYTTADGWSHELRPVRGDIQKWIDARFGSLPPDSFFEDFTNGHQENVWQHSHYRNRTELRYIELISSNLDPLLLTDGEPVNNPAHPDVQQFHPAVTGISLFAELPRFEK